MHELGIAKDLFRIVVEKAEEHSIKKITKIRIIVGEASGIDADYLKHSLMDHIVPGTAAEGTELEFISEKLKAKCSACGTDIKYEKGYPPIFTCPSCGSTKIETVSGTNTYVESIEGN